MDLITTFQKKREKQAGNGNEPSKPNSVERTVDIQEPVAALPIDAKPRRLLLKDDYTEIFQEVVRCEYLCRQRNLRYDRRRYPGDYDLRKRKEFLFAICLMIVFKNVWQSKNLVKTCVSKNAQMLGDENMNKSNELYKTANAKTSFICESLLGYVAQDGKQYDKIALVLVLRDGQNKAQTTVRYYLDVPAAKVLMHDLFYGKLNQSS